MCTLSFMYFRPTRFTAGSTELIHVRGGLPPPPASLKPLPSRGFFVGWANRGTRFRTARGSRPPPIPAATREPPGRCDTTGAHPCRPCDPRSARAVRRVGQDPSRSRGGPGRGNGLVGGTGGRWSVSAGGAGRGGNAARSARRYAPRAVQGANTHRPATLTLITENPYRTQTSGYK